MGVFDFFVFVANVFLTLFIEQFEGLTHVPQSIVEADINLIEI